MARREIFAGNWKMYKTLPEAIELVKALDAGLQKKDNREVAIFTPSPFIYQIAELCKDSIIDTGVQNMYFENEGAFTGEVSPLVVKDSKARYILIGHSERRHVFGETNEQVNKKVHIALEIGIEPMICVGEMLEDRESNNTESVIKEQIESALKDVSSSDMKKIVLAYEPVWAIGTGKVATPEIADETHLIIRDIVKSLYNDDVAQNVSILYGGSVKPGNIQGLYVKENIDGVLVGGASLKSDSFLDICNVD